MTDMFSKARRSEMMSLIRSHGNKATEIRLIEIFRQFKITGWRRKQKLLGKPDFVFRESRVAVFVDGCFWHGCPKCYKRPSSNQEFWDAKFVNNKRRDRRINRELPKEGWKVFRIWEHQLKAPEKILIKLLKIKEASKD